MKKIRNIIALALLVTFVYSCDADATIDDVQADVDKTELVVADTGNEENEGDGKDD